MLHNISRLSFYNRVIESTEEWGHEQFNVKLYEPLLEDSHRIFRVAAAVGALKQQSTVPGWADDARQVWLLREALLFMFEIAANGVVQLYLRLEMETRSMHLNGDVTIKGPPLEIQWWSTHPQHIHQINHCRGELHLSPCRDAQIFWRTFSLDNYRISQKVYWRVFNSCGGVQVESR